MFLTGRAAVAVVLRVVNIISLTQHPLFMVGKMIGDDPVNFSLFQSPADRGAYVAGIQTDLFNVKTESLPLPVKAIQLRHTVVGIGGGDEGVGDQVVTTVDVAVIQVKETVRLAVPDHEAALGVGGADLDLFGRNVLLLDRRASCRALPDPC